MSMGSAAIELHFYHLLITKYWIIVAITIFLYDYLLTFRSEVRLVWKLSWGFGKVLFLLARYSTVIEVPLTLWLYFVPNVSPKSCFPGFVLTMCISMIGLASAEAILFLRTCALYNNATKISLTLLSILISTQVTAIVIIALYLCSVKFGPPPLSFFGNCYNTARSRIIFGGFLLLLTQETVVFVFTIFRAAQTGIQTKDHLRQTLYRDGLLYYLFLIIISIGNIIMVTKGPITLSEILQPFLRAMHAVLSTRVLLNARGAMRHRELTTTDFESVFTSFVHWTVSIDGDCERQMAISSSE